MKAIDQLNETAWTIRRSDRSKSKELAKVALSKSIDSDYKLGEAISQLTLGTLEVYKANFIEALGQLDSAMPILVEFDHKVSILRALNSYGFIYINLGDYEKALPRLLEGLKLAKKIKDYELASFLLYNLSEIHKDPAFKQYDLALDYLFEALKYCEKGLSSIHGLILAAIATTYYKIPDWDSAISYTQDALKIVINETDLATKVQCLLMLSDVYYEHGDYQKAKSIALQSLDVHDDYQNEFNIASVYIIVSKIELKLGDLESAKQWAEKSYVMAKKDEMNSLLSDASALLGHIAEHYKDFSQATMYYKETLKYNEKRYTKGLEQRLSAHTAELQHIKLQKESEIRRLKNVELKKKSDELEKMVAELKMAQEQIVQSEKMAALGELISGIAHEINTPFGAIQASVQSVLGYAVKTLSVELPNLLTAMKREDRDILFEMLAASVEQNVLLSTREERAHRRRILNELQEMGIKNAEQLSDDLTDIGIFHNIYRYEPLFKAPISNQIIMVCKGLAGILRNLHNIEVSVTKASKVIYALKYYTHYSPVEEKVPADIVEGIEQTLNLFYNTTKGKVEIEKQFEPLPKILCHIDELNQVWINLVQNALQAMSHHGILTIRTYISVENEEEKVHVEIEDNGPGIKEELLDKIFEPFFTTKPKGVGSGLGLSLVKKIVDKHNGQILVNSQAGKTIFHVILSVSERQ